MANRRVNYTCIVPGCGRDAHGIQFCSSHHRQHLRGKPTEEMVPFKPKGVYPCAAKCGCQREVTREGSLCTAHRQQKCKDPDRPLRPLRGSLIKTCLDETCERKGRLASGYCRTHESQMTKWGQTWEINGDIPPEVSKRMMTGKTPRAPRKIVVTKGRLCEFEGCGRKHHSKGLCVTHDWQMKRTGRTWAIGTSTNSGRRPKKPRNEKLPAGWFNKTLPTKKKRSKAGMNQVEAGYISMNDFRPPTREEQIAAMSTIMNHDMHHDRELMKMVFG